MPRTTLLFAAALLTVRALAQEPTTIHGTVHEEFGDPVPGANVKLIAGNQLVAETSATSDGAFEFDSLAPGTYDVAVVKAGFCISQGLSTILQANVDVGLNVILRKPERPVPPLIRVSSAVQHARLLRVVQPEYPANAEGHHIGGTVSLNLLIDEYGSPIEVHASGGSSPFFTQSAIDAVRQRRYRSTALNCVPVKVAAQVSFEVEPDARAVSIGDEL